MRALTLAALLLTTGIAIADDQASAYYGFSIQVDVDWKIDLKSAVINAVQPDSPAAKAGIVKGDLITDIESCAVPGCGAYKAKKLMQKPIGETLHLQLEHADGHSYNANLLGVTPPPKISPQKAG